MIPFSLQIQNQDNSWTAKDIWEIFEPNTDYSSWTEAQKVAYALDKCMYPTQVVVTSETYSRNVERSANYVLENITLVNAKAKPEFTWSLVKQEYVERLLSFLRFHYDYEQGGLEVRTEEAPRIKVTYMDLSGLRTIIAYLGQTMTGTLVEYEGQLYWQDFRIAFPEI